MATRRSNSWLVIIGVFKLVKAAFLVALAVGALELRRGDAMSPARDLALLFHFDPHGRVATWLMTEATALSPRRLTFISIATAIYAGLFVLEGVGLVMRRRWGEIVTIAITGSFIPWEVYEAIKAASPAKLALIAANLAIIIYLAWRLKSDARSRGVSTV